jgi:hypothetical protein
MRFTWRVERLGDVREGDHLKAEGVGRRIILKWVLKKCDKGHGVD